MGNPRSQSNYLIPTYASRCVGHYKMKDLVMKYDHNAFKAGKTLKLSIIACVLFIITQTLSETRHLFGYDPNWAGSNFSWNLTFYYPMNLLILIINLIVLIRYIFFTSKSGKLIRKING